MEIEIFHRYRQQLSMQLLLNYKEFIQKLFLPFFTATEIFTVLSIPRRLNYLLKGRFKSIHDTHRTRPKLKVLSTSLLSSSSPQPAFWLFPLPKVFSLTMQYHLLTVIWGCIQFSVIKWKALNTMLHEVKIQTHVSTSRVSAWNITKW